MFGGKRDAVYTDTRHCWHISIDSHIISGPAQDLIEIKAVLVALRQRGAELALLPLERPLRAGERLDGGRVFGLVRRPSVRDCKIRVDRISISDELSTYSKEY